MNDFENYLIDALEQVWDIPDENLSQALLSEAQRLANCCSQFQYDGSQPEFPCTSHR